MRRGARALWIAATTVVVALAAAELGLRVLRPVQHRAPLDTADLPPGVTVFHRASAHPGVPYELMPGAHGTYSGVDVAVNALGQRGPEVDRAKPAGTYRVVVLGDSLTFGYGASQATIWPAALERELAPHATELGANAVQVLNLGVSGYNAADEAAVLAHVALDLEPDVVVVGYFLNDPQIAPLPAVQRWFRTPEWWERSHLLRLFDAWRFARAKERFGGDAYRWLHDEPGDGWHMVVSAFDAMHRAASARGVRVLVATLPAFPPGPDWSRYPWGDLHARVLAAARGSGLETLDTLPAFVADGRRPKDLCVDFEHPNGEGSAVIARAVAAEIVRSARPPDDGKPR